MHKPFLLLVERERRGGSDIWAARGGRRVQKKNSRPGAPLSLRFLILFYCKGDLRRERPSGSPAAKGDPKGVNRGLATT